MSPCHLLDARAEHAGPARPQARLPVGVQARKTRFKLKALLSFSQSNFETGVELAPPYLADHPAMLPRVKANNAGKSSAPFRSLQA